MFSHVYIPVSDLDAAFALYQPLMECLGHPLRFREPDPQGRPWAGWQTRDGIRPLLVIGRPFNGAPVDPGNGPMAAFTASSRAQVHQAHELALAAGATCEGPPGLRPHYHAHYYGAYFRDRDGNKLCVVCHEAA